MLAASGSNAMTSDLDDIVDIIPAFYYDVWNKWKIKQNYVHHCLSLNIYERGGVVLYYFPIKQMYSLKTIYSALLPSSTTWKEGSEMEEWAKISFWLGFAYNVRIFVQLSYLLHVYNI